MALLTVSNIKKMFSVDTVLENISFEIQKNDHIGLVGVNGSGKTTLFKVISKEYDSDEGQCIFSKETKISYMEQHVCKDEEITAYDEVLSVFSDILNLEQELETLTEKLSHKHSKSELDKLIALQTDLSEKFNDIGGLTFRNRVKSTLQGLGFTEKQSTEKVVNLSGGQKGKLQLAKMLLSGANLLLLDEPTNHLDINATEWLEDFLKAYSGAFMVISHDRYFLDKITNKTFELSGTLLHKYNGNYTAFIKQKDERILSMQRVYENTQKEIKRIEGIIEQQKRFNQERNYITIASKQKSIDRLEATLEKPPESDDTMNFEFSVSRRGGNDVLFAQNLALSFGNHNIFSGVSMEIYRKDRVFLLGPNGCGKTSLLKILLDIYKSDEGKFSFGSNIDIGYYDQAQDNLDPKKTVIDEIWDLHPLMTQTEIRSALAVFLFKGEDVFKPISGLSGGERARILLLKLMMSDTNFLILDEPTNHLDISSREALESALLNYGGTLLVVSHDRYLINKLSNKILYLNKDGIDTYNGNYDYFLEKRESKAEVLSTAPIKVNEYKLNKERKSELRKLNTQISKCEEDIERIDAEISTIEIELASPEVASDYVKALDLTNRMHELKEESENLLLLWEELHAKLLEYEE